MYSNTGEKIKGFAKFCAFCEITFCVIVGLVLFSFTVSEPFADISGWYNLLFLVSSFLIGVIGSLLSWLKYLFLAGYGELIYNTRESCSELKAVSSELKDINKVLAKQLNSPGDNS